MEPTDIFIFIHFEIKSQFLIIKQKNAVMIVTQRVNQNATDIEYIYVSLNLVMLGPYSYIFKQVPY